MHRAFVLRLPIDDATVCRIIDTIVIPAATHQPTDQHCTQPIDIHERSQHDAQPRQSGPDEVTLEHDDGHGHGHLGLALVVISIAQLMVVLDATIVNIAIPYITEDLDFSNGNQPWIITGYTLAFGGLLLLGGRLGDLFGRRRIFMIGVWHLRRSPRCSAASRRTRSCCSAPAALQGLGAAIASPTALALITTTFPAGKERNRAFAVYAAMSGAGAAVGLILGGWLTEYSMALDVPDQRADRHRSPP